MRKDIEQKLKEMYIKGCSENDIEEFCLKHKVSESDAFLYIAELRAPNCCKGCKNVALYDNMYPCTACARNKRDFFAKRD